MSCIAAIKSTLCFSISPPPTLSPFKTQTARLLLRYPILKFEATILKDILNEYIPEAIFEVPKKGFGIPLKTWIRNELRAEFFEHLNDKELKKIENLNIDLIKKYLDKHLSGEEDYSSYLWRVYVLIKWMKLNG